MTNLIYILIDLLVVILFAFSIKWLNLIWNSWEADMKWHYLNVSISFLFATSFFPVFVHFINLQDLQSYEKRNENIQEMSIIAIAKYLGYLI